MRVNQHCQCTMYTFLCVELESSSSGSMFIHSYIISRLAVSFRTHLLKSMQYHSYVTNITDTLVMQTNRHLLVAFLHLVYYQWLKWKIRGGKLYI